MAQLARKCPDTVSRDLQIVVAYFNHLIQAPTELHDSIREALISIAPAFRWQLKQSENGPGGDEFVPNSNLKLLLALLTEHTESKLTIVQNVVCVFLTTCFPDHYVPARYLLLLIAGERYARSVCRFATESLTSDFSFQLVAARDSHAVSVRSVEEGPYQLHVHLVGRLAGPFAEGERGSQPFVDGAAARGAAQFHADDQVRARDVLEAVAEVHVRPRHRSVHV